jgi:two-component system response regulator MprA
MGKSSHIPFFIQAAQGRGLDRPLTNNVPMKGRKSILIIDDDADVLLFLGDRLNARGYDVLTAINGQEGLEVLQSQSVDGVLLDLHMPVMGGIALLEKLGTSSTTPPVIVMSATENRSELLQAILKGAMDFLIKPITQDELTSKCFRLFQQSYGN